MYHRTWARGAALCASMALHSTGLAQCVDWADGYGIDEMGCDGEVSVMLSVEEGGQQVVYVGGVFSHIGGIDATSLARWNGTSWSEVGGGVAGVVEELAVYDDGSGSALYVGGHFYEAGGEPIAMLARYADGVWSEVGGAGLTNPVQAMAVHDGLLFVAGRFSEIAGQASEHIASWDGSAWQVFSSGPSPREGDALAYDAARGETVLFSGDEVGSGGHQPDTWAFSSGAWSQVATTGATAREGHSMTYDSLRQRVVLYGGGVTTNNWDSRLFAWEGTAWTQIADYMPVSRRESSIVYDSARDRVVCFSGKDPGGSYIDDTWEFDGTQWAEVVPATTRPPARGRYSMAYDAARGEVIVFGGYSSSLGALGDTWAWNGVDWTQVASTGPSARYGHKMAYDSARQMIVMYGGRGDAGWDKDTWGWDGTQWVLLAPFDPSRPDDSHGDMAYDSAADRVVMRDELGVTWLWDGSAWEFLHEGGLNEEVFDLASFDAGGGPELYACGYFTQAGAIPARRIARLTDDGWAPLGAGVQSNWCYVMQVWDDGGGDDLYVGGPFDMVDNQQIRGIARWNGSEWSALNVGDPTEGGGVNGSVRSILAYDDGSGEKLYAGGDFQAVDGSSGDIPAGNIASWDGSVWEPLSGFVISPPGGGVFAMIGSTVGGEDRLFAGGEFDEAGGKPSASFGVWGDPCGPPTIVAQPVDVIAVELEPVSFEVGAWGTRPLSFQWRKDGGDLVDDSRISGATTERLVIDPWIESDAGVYSVLVTNAYGSVESDPAGLTTFPGGGSGGVVTVATVMLPPEPCPWDDSTSMQRVGGGTSSATGEGVFWAESASDGIDAYFRWSGGEHETIVKVDDPAPGTDPGVLFGNYQRNLTGGAFASRDGVITFKATVSGDGVDQTNDVGVWRSIGTDLELVQREGDQLPGFPDGVTLNGTFGGSAEMSYFAGPGGWMTLMGSPEGGGYDPAIDRAMLRMSPDTSGEVLIQRFAPAPLIGTNTLDMWPPARINTSGEALLVTSVESRTGYKRNPNGWDAALFLGSPGAFTLVAHSGDPAPGFAPDVNLDTIGGGLDVRLSETGDIVLGCRVAGPDGFWANALYHWRAGVLTPLALQGEAAPGIPNDLPYFDADVHAMNSLGDAVFAGRLNNNGCQGDCPTSAVFISIDDVPDAVAYRGMTPVPGLGDGFSYEGTVRSAINDEREAVLSGGVLLNGQSLAGVFGWIEDGGMFPIAVPGSQLEVAPDDVRVVVEAKLTYIDIGVDGDHLRQAGLSDDGRFLFTAGFSDGTQGLFEGRFVDFLRNYFPCVADFNFDGSVNTLDVLAFLNAWSSGDSSADINDDGAVNTLDVLAFLNLWSAGCD